MEIHPPEHPIRSVRDFLLQIFTVTCGILIALGLEQLVESRRVGSLAAHARAQLHDEIYTNRDRIRTVLSGEPGLEAALTAWSDWCDARLAGRSARVPHMASLAERHFMHVSSSAWDAAVATQAVVHFRFAETHALIEAYNRAEIVNQLTARAIEQWVALAGFGDPEHLPDTAVMEAARTVRIAFAYAHSIASNAQLLLADYDAAEKALR